VTLERLPGSGPAWLESLPNAPAVRNQMSVGQVRLRITMTFLMKQSA